MKLDVFLYEDQPIPKCAICAAITDWNAANLQSGFEFVPALFHLRKLEDHSQAMEKISGLTQGQYGFSLDMQMDNLGTDRLDVERFKSLGIDQEAAEKWLWGLKILRAIKDNTQIEAVVLVASSKVVEDTFEILQRKFVRDGLHLRHTGGNFTGSDGAQDDERRVSRRATAFLEDIVSVFGTPIQRASPLATKRFFED